MIFNHSYVSVFILTVVVSLFIRLISYLAAAPFVFIFLHPNALLWSYWAALPTGSLIGAVVCISLPTLSGDENPELMPFLLIGGGYGAITAFAVIRARRKMLEQ
ncbi:hypothetical protein N9969_02210 [Akkermansiaceae bacterium]|nr:hypothetical protein [Akkermansiaceae bacterium]